MPRTIRQSRNPWWVAALVCCCLLESSGCSLFVMTGKMLQGDPMTDDEFKTWYGKSMEKSGKKVAVLCSTPESVKSEFSSLDMDLSSEVSNKFHRNKINIIGAHKVASWMDDHGGGDFDVRELGNDLGAELVVSIKLDHFDFREENSPDLFRGRARGNITVHELVRESSQPKSSPSKPDSKADSKAKRVDNADTADGAKKTSKPGKSDKPGSKVIGIRQVMAKTFDITYPPHQPVTIEQMQPDTFRKKFTDRVADELSRTFYRHKPGVAF